MMVVARSCRIQSFSFSFASLSSCASTFSLACSPSASSCESSWSFSKIVLSGLFMKTVHSLRTSSGIISSPDTLSVRHYLPPSPSFFFSGFSSRTIPLFTRPADRLSAFFKKTFSSRPSFSPSSSSTSCPSLSLSFKPPTPRFSTSCPSPSAVTFPLYSLPLSCSNNHSHIQGFSLSAFARLFATTKTTAAAASRAAAAGEAESTAVSSRRKAFVHSSSSAGAHVLDGPQAGRDVSGGFLLNDETREKQQRSLFDCWPPPSKYLISLHENFKVQAALCVDRLPLHFEEPEYEVKWRQWKEAWEARTGNGLPLPDSLTFMNFPFQFYETEDVKKQREKKIQHTGDADISELELLLSQQGLAQLALKKLKRTEILSSQVRQPETERARAAAFESKSALREDFHTLQREPTKLLFLIVKYGNLWSFPLADRIHGQSMRLTLQRLCREQLGHSFSPYFLGYCPFTYEKKRYRDGAVLKRGVEGRKVFYYRGRYVPETANVSLSREGAADDFAWVTSKELADFLSPDAMRIIAPGLPLEP